MGGCGWGIGGSTAIWPHNLSTQCWNETFKIKATNKEGEKADPWGGGGENRSQATPASYTVACGLHFDVAIPLDLIFHFINWHYFQ